MEKTLPKHLLSAIAIKTNIKGKGKLIIHFENDDDASWIFDHLHIKD